MDYFILFLVFYFIVIIFLAFIFGDIKAIIKADPALKNYLEILFYPSIYAIANYRVFRLLYLLKVPILPRFYSQLVRFFTSIEIHPGAKIGRNFFIDHGNGVVIGETAVIGNNVIIYHQVTLGGTGKEQGKRHPTVKDNVIIGAGAKILGNIIIEDYCKVGAGAIVLQNIPSHSTVVGNPARIVKSKSIENILDFDLGNLPDPLREDYERLDQLIKKVVNNVKCLQKDDNDNTINKKDNY
jgi:serine O-acetyltransferase